MLELSAVRLALLMQQLSIVHTIPEGLDPFGWMMLDVRVQRADCKTVQRRYLEITIAATIKTQELPVNSDKLFCPSCFANACF